jgi:hypothetical protein
VHWRRLDAEAHLGYRKGKQSGVWFRPFLQLERASARHIGPGELHSPWIFLGRSRAAGSANAIDFPRRKRWEHLLAAAIDRLHLRPRFIGDVGDACL